MGFFSLDCSERELSELFQPTFFLSLTVFEIQGAQKGKNAIFVTTSNFYFSSNFDRIFFIRFLSMRAFRIVTVDFFYLLPFSRYKGPKRAKMWFLRLHQIFIFHPILMGCFSLDSSQWELSELYLMTMPANQVDCHSPT